MPRSQRRLAAVLASDVVGYSRLMGEDDEATVEAIVATRRLMSRLVARHGGRVVDAPGDALLAAFPSALDSARCAVAIQRSMHGRNALVTEARRMQLRIGLHLGDVIERDAALYGDGVNIAARLQALAEPGGICLSESVHVQVTQRLGLTARDAGEQALKNIAQTVRLFHLQLLASSPAAQRPAVLPPAEGPALFGRSDDLAALLGDVAAHRLVTLVGAGGIGKTSLARAAASAAAARLTEGHWWIDLAVVADASQIAPAVAKALQIQLGDTDPASALASAVVEREGLLILDNCEHVVGGVADVVDALLRSGPRLRILATSQEPLRVAGEHVRRLQPLAVPPTDASLEVARRYAALQLLETRAVASDPQFVLSDTSVSTAITICQQLDGIALAIEMAAARLPVLGLQTLLDKLGNRLQLLRSGTRGAPTRQQTLRATLDWSHNLLSPEEQAVLRRLSVFAGSFRLDAAQQVGSGNDLDEWACLDAFTSLVEKSLVQRQPGDPLRYRLLETMRLYAAERLDEAGERLQAEQAHGRATKILADEAMQAYYSLSDGLFFDTYLLDDDDVQLALDRAIDRVDMEVVASTLQLHAVLGREHTPRAVERRRNELIHALLPMASARAKAVILCRFARFLGVGVPGTSRLDAAEQAVTASLAFGDPILIFEGLWALAVRCAQAGDWPRADEVAARARNEEIPTWPARLRMVGAIYAVTLPMLRGDAMAFRATTRTTLRLCEQAGAVRAAGWQLHNLGDAALIAGDYEEAIDLERRVARDFAARHEYRRLCWAWANLLTAHLMLGQTSAAVDVARQVFPLAARMGMLGDVLDHAALLAIQLDRLDDAGRLLGAADAASQRSGNPRQVNEARIARMAADALLAGLGEPASAALRAEGKQLTEAQAHQLAGQLLHHS